MNESWRITADTSFSQKSKHSEVLHNMYIYISNIQFTTWYQMFTDCMKLLEKATRETPEWQISFPRRVVEFYVKFVADRRTLLNKASVYKNNYITVHK